MFDFLRNLTKSAEEKRQEAAAAYLDGALSDRARQLFEQEMAQDRTLQAEVEQLRLIQQSLRQLPLRQVPRNFVLNPAEYRRPAPQPWVQAYPVLRTATALAAFFFIFAVVAGTFTSFRANFATNSAPAADVAQVESISATTVVTESVETFAFEEGEAVAADEAIADEASANDMAEESAEEALLEEVVEEELAAEAPPVVATQVANATAAASPTAVSGQDDAAADGSTATEPVPTPTVSTLPRVTPPTPLPDRDPALTEAEEAAAPDETAYDAVADDQEADAAGSREQEEVESAEPATDSNRGVGTLPWLQVGLGLLLLLLAGLTFYARKQR